MDPIFNDTSTHATTSPAPPASRGVAEAHEGDHAIHSAQEDLNVQSGASLDNSNAVQTDHGTSCEGGSFVPNESSPASTSMLSHDILQWSTDATRYPPSNPGSTVAASTSDLVQQMGVPGFQFSHPHDHEQASGQGNADDEGEGNINSAAQDAAVGTFDTGAHHDPSGLLDSHMTDDASSRTASLQTPHSSNMLPPRPPTQETEGFSSPESKANASAPTHESTHSSQPHLVPPEPTFKSLTVEPPPILTAGAPGTSMPAANHLPPPPGTGIPTGFSTSTVQGEQSVPSTPGVAALEPSSEGRSRGNRRRKRDEDESARDEDTQWGKETQAAYDSFLEFENTYVKDGNWDRFPAFSRIFVGGYTTAQRKGRHHSRGSAGNLATEKVVKRDLFHFFHKYGRLAQISLKQAYGFIQFMDPFDANRALKALQGVAIRGKKIRASFFDCS